MRAKEPVVLVLLFFILLGIAVYGYQFTVGTPHTSTISSSYAPYVTGTSESARDVFINNTILDTCIGEGEGAFQLRVVSDSGGVPVRGEIINGVNDFACGNNEQVVYINNFTAGPGGWLTPVLPIQATPYGSLNFTVAYQGVTYHFSANYPIFFGKECVTLHVPSGNVTMTAMNAGVCS